MSIKKYFINKEEHRLRAGWRILVFMFTFMTFALLVQTAIKPLIGPISKSEFVRNYSIVLIAIAAFGATIMTPIARKVLDKKTFISLGLKFNKSALKDLGFGFLLSGFMAGLVFMVMILFDLIQFNGINFGGELETNENISGFVSFMSIVSVGSLFILLLETVLVGWWEEIVFRGYIFQNMIDGMGLKIAIAISCFIYGLIHAMNPNAGILSSLIIILFGYLRIYGLLRTKMLWLSIGMHIGWNFFQGPIFGYPASGHIKASLINQTSSAASWLSGGEFGPEGSIIIIPIIILALYIMNWWSKRAK